jgi:2'-5' RNA ligase
MQAQIFRPRATKTVAIKAGHWIAATAFQLGSEDISWHAAILASEIKFARFWIMGVSGRGRRTFSSMKKTAIAYWLIPAEPARSFFAAMIGDPARRYNAPVFEPHMTVHVSFDLVDAEKLITKVARSCRPVQAEVLKVRQSPEFIKTFFVELALNSKLQRLNEMIRDAAQKSSDYELKPHLSLLYKTMSIQGRRQLVQSIKIPFLEVIFDSIQVIRCVAPTRSRADVEGWRVVAAKRIGV